MADAPIERLVAERVRTLEQIKSLRRTFDDIVTATEDVAVDDEHDPEGHTIAWDRQQTAALLASTEARLSELDEALRRIETRTYGRCESCGRPIGEARLEALPTTPVCVDCAA